ncbi:hypothetical protein SL1157_1652 [Ruegeria lacuscaerulensis ITI-1157]|nr:hypothetical protein SL1157_1652 [Ruegeria lacuscaerulensis ITI-1157]
MTTAGEMISFSNRLSQTCSQHGSSQINAARQIIGNSLT